MSNHIDNQLHFDPVLNLQNSSIRDNCWLFCRLFGVDVVFAVVVAAVVVDDDVVVTEILHVKRNESFFVTLGATSLV